MTAATSSAGGRLLNIVSNENQGISEQVTISNCRFDNSWNHASVVQGRKIKFQNCSGSRNCRRNENGQLGVWPYAMGSWPIFDRNNKPTIFCEDIEFNNCHFVDTFGEVLAINYSHGARFIGNKIENARFVGIYSNTCSDVFMHQNDVSNSNPVEGRGNEFRAFEISTEAYGSLPRLGQSVSPATLTLNKVHGNNIRHGLRYNPHRDTNSTYDNWKLRGNDWGETEQEPVRIEKATGARPHSCTTDKRLVGYVGNPEAWSLTGSAVLQPALMFAPSEYEVRSAPSIAP